MSSPNFLPLIKFNHQHRMRSLVVFYGSNSWCLNQAKQLIPHYSNGLFVSANNNIDAQNWLHIEEKKFRTQLGREWDAVIYDAEKGITPDVLGAVAGCVKAGGLFIVCLESALIQDSSFHQWIEYQIKQDPHVWLCREDGCVREGEYPVISNRSLLDIETKYATQEQKIAVDAIKRVLTGHRNRPLVLTADRGRGKTSSLGLAAKALIEETERDIQILVTAPKPSAVDNLFAQLDDCDKKHVLFIAPDLLSDELPSCDLLLVDEAAAIPVPLLEIWAQHYKRIVFSSTVHGYEGAGRGFTLKFDKKLQQIAPAYKKLHIHQPIRWAQGCPLEDFVFKALLLKNEVIPLQSKISLQELEFMMFDFSQSIEERSSLLEQAFAILVSAHYQTSPNDLKNLLDLNEVSLFLAISPNKDAPRVVGAILVIQEGGIDVSLCEDIMQGKRRIKGHLIAQSLMTHSGNIRAGILTCWRIMRIAVHPQMQWQGIGSYMLQKLQQKADIQGIDYLATSYGVTAELLSFWRKQAFQTLALGIKRDAASGTYSIQSIAPISESSQTLAQQVRISLRWNLPHLLLTHCLELDPSLIVQLAKDLEFETPDVFINTQINDYKGGYIGADFIGASLNRWLWYKLSISSTEQLEKEVKSSVQLDTEVAFIIDRILLSRDWKYLIAHYGKSLSIAGQRQAKLKLLKIIKDLS